MNINILLLVINVSIHNLAPTLILVKSLVDHINQITEFTSKMSNIVCHSEAKELINFKSDVPHKHYIGLCLYRHYNVVCNDITLDNEIGCFGPLLFSLDICDP